MASVCRTEGRGSNSVATPYHFEKQEGHAWFASAGRPEPNPCTAWEIDCTMRGKPKGLHHRYRRTYFPVSLACRLHREIDISGLFLCRTPDPGFSPLTNPGSFF